MRDHFVVTRVNAEKGEGVDLKERYSVPGYPTMIFVDTQGREIDRLIGYRPPDAFLAKADSVSRNLGTVPFLEQAVAQDPNDGALWKRLAAKYEERGDYQRAHHVWESLAELGSQPQDLVEYKLLTLQARLDHDPAPLVRFVHDHPDHAYLPDIYNAGLSLFRRQDAPEEEGKFFLSFVNYMEKQGKGGPGLWNSFAWRMTEIEQNLPVALDKITRAVDLMQNSEPKDRAQVMDTQAEVLWKLGRTAEALDVMEKCIALQPDDPYYQKQKEKFLGKAS